MLAYDKEAVRGRLVANVRDVPQHYGIPFRVSGNELLVGVCPSCGPRTRRDAVGISATSGAWVCRPHGCSGDVFALVGGYAGLDPRRDFERVLAIAADIAGVAAGETVDTRIEHEQARRQRIADETARREADAGRARESARRRASVAWRFVGRWLRQHDGETYLRARRIDARTLFDRDLVRFSGLGDVVVAQYDFASELINVVRRLRDPKPEEPKVRGLAKCPTSGSLVGRVRDIGSGSTMIVEGVMDSLTAASIWPEYVVLGANGAGRYAELARVAAEHVVEKHGRLFLVGDGDEAGKRALAAAIKAATEVGLRLAHDLVLVDLRGHADLNAAVCAGWRPR